MSSGLQFNGYQNSLAIAGQTLRRRWLAFAALSLAVAFGVGFIVGQPLNIGLALSFLFLLFGPFIPPVRKRIRPMYAVGEAMKTFAKDNEFFYEESIKPNHKRDFLPAIARTGIWERHEQVATGLYKGKFLSTYVDTSRHMLESQLSRRAIRVYEITLPKVLPHIVMVNRQNGNSFMGTITRHFDDDQRVMIEGNFEDKFTTYSHRRTHTEALSILAPNVLATLLDHNDKFDIEIVGDHLYLYTEDYLTDADEFKKAFAFIDRLMKHLDHRMRSLKFTIPNKKRYPYMASRPGFGVMTIGHKYYSAGWAVIAAYTAHQSIQLVNPHLRSWRIGAIIFFDIVMAGVLIYYRRQYQQTREG